MRTLLYRTTACLSIAVLGALLTSAAYGSVIFQDDFEGGNLAKTTNGFKWTAATSTLVTSDGQKKGQYSLRFRFVGKPKSTTANEEEGDAFAEQRFALGAQVKDLWVKYDMWVPANYYHRVEVGSNNNKGLLMLWSGAYSGIQNTSFHFWPANGAANLGDSQISVARKSNGVWVADSHIMTGTVDVNHRPAAQGGDAGRWVTWVVHAKVADVNSFNGAAQIWKDGKKIMDLTNLENWAPAASNYFDVGYLLGWANSGFTETTDIYLDNVIFGTTAADVGIGVTTPMAPVLSSPQ